MCGKLGWPSVSSLTCKHTLQERAQLRTLKHSQSLPKPLFPPEAPSQQPDLPQSLPLSLTLCPAHALQVGGDSRPYSSSGLEGASSPNLLTQQMRKRCPERPWHLLKFKEGIGVRLILISLHWLRASDVSGLGLDTAGT